MSYNQCKLHDILNEQLNICHTLMLNGKLNLVTMKFIAYNQLLLYNSITVLSQQHYKVFDVH